MKNDKIFRCLALICLALIFCGCAGPKVKRPDIAFYHLDYPPPEPAATEPAAGAIAIESFTVMPPFNTNRIIYSTTEVSRNAYVYHQWFSDPSEMVFGLFFRDMRSSGIFRAVMPGDERLADYRIEGIVESILERDYEDPWQAVLSITITLIDKKERDLSKQIRLQKNYTSIQPCARKNPHALAEAMSMAMAEVSARIIADVRDAVVRPPEDMIPQ
jgi:ABC-type uncharacterized transport system auxiliary subunit